MNYFRKSWKQQITVKGAGANAHVCGAVMNHGDTVRDDGCTVRHDCPVAALR